MPFQIDDMRPFSTDPDANEMDPTGDEHFLTTGHCPVCQRRGFVFGPRGGAAVNIECANVKCRQRYNVTLDERQRVVLSQRIPRTSVWLSEPAQ